MNEHHQPFEEIRHYGTEGQEFWSARELAPLLDYRDWRNFQKVLARATQACEASNQAASDHFVETTKMVVLGSGAQRELEDVHLSRYACYLVVQELADDEAFRQLREDEKRLFLRNELKEHNKQLVEAAQQAGGATAIDFAIFQNHGYRGLYGGLDQKAIHQRKGLKKNQKILDHMGSTELAANLFRATQTEEKLKRDGVNSKQQANTTHFDVGRKVRQTIQELGGTMPEELPTPQVSIKQLENSVKITEKK